MDPNLHLDDTWLDTFTKLRMTAFGQTVIDIANNADYDEWTFSQKIAFALDKEVTARQERRVEKLLKAVLITTPRCLRRRHRLPTRSQPQP